MFCIIDTGKPKEDLKQTSGTDSTAGNDTGAGDTQTTERGEDDKGSDNHDGEFCFCIPTLEKLFSLVF